MTFSKWVLGKLADPYSPTSLGFRARQRRMQWLLERFPDFCSMRVLDLGGDVRSWSHSSARPAHLTIVGLDDWTLRDPEPWMDVLLADACQPDAMPAGYDLVYSNSVIEHVGGPRHRRGFAQAVRQCGAHYWVQTPYRYFPLEPHFVFPGFQFLPPLAKKQIAAHWPLSQTKGNPDYDPLEYAMDHDLLTVTEMKALFPQGEILRERVGPFVKSLVAVR